MAAVLLTLHALTVHAAVLQAKVHFKTHVVALAGPKNQEYVKELGADKVLLSMHLLPRAAPCASNC